MAKAVVQMKHTLTRELREWRERLIEQETDPGVLSHLLAPWQLSRSMNRRTAPGYAAAIERRLQRGDLDERVRGQAVQALAHAGIHAPAAAGAALARIASDDPDEKLRNFARDAAAVVQGGEANADTIQKAWQKQYPPQEHDSTSFTLVTGTVKTGEAKPESDGDGATDE